MTTIKNRKEYTIDGKRYLVEQYQDKDMQVALWRYGELTDDGRGRILRDGLRTRPNMNRLFGRNK